MEDIFRIAPGEVFQRVRLVAGKEQRITKRSDYQAVQRAGRARANSLLVLKAMTNPTLQGATGRFGFSVSKAVGKAVVRNRVRRRLKEVTRRLPLRHGMDVVMIARPAAAEASFRDIELAAAQLLTKAGLLEERR